MSEREKEASVKGTGDELNSQHLERWAQGVCVCVTERDGQTERERQRERKIERESLRERTHRSRRGERTVCVKVSA